MSLKTLTLIIRLYKAFRGLLVFVVSLAILLPVALYITLSSDWAQRKIAYMGETQLSSLLGTEVSIGEVHFSPFNKLRISDVAVADDNDSTGLAVREIATRFELWDLIFRQKIIIDYATISGLDMRLYRDSLGAPLNIDGIVKRLAKPKSESDSTLFRLRLNDLSISDCSFSYHVLDAPATPERFNPNHIDISHLSIEAFAPVISNDDIRLWLRNLSFYESSGVEVSNLSFNAQLSPSALVVGDLTVGLPNSSLAFSEICVPIDSIGALAHFHDYPPVKVCVRDDSHVFLPDLKAFVPALASLDYNLNLACDIDAAPSALVVNALSVSDTLGIINLNLSGSAEGLQSLDSLQIHDLAINLVTDTVAISSALRLVSLPPKTREIIRHLGNTRLVASASGTLFDGRADVDVRSSLAVAAVKGHFTRGTHGYPFRFVADVDLDSLNLGIISGSRDLHSLSAEAQVDGVFSAKSLSANAKADVSAFDFKGYRYRDIKADVSIGREASRADVRISDPNIKAVVLADWSLADSLHSLSLDMACQDVRLDALGLSDAFPGHTISGAVNAVGSGYSIDRFCGNIALYNLALSAADGSGAKLRNLEIFADNLHQKGRIAVASDFINGEIDGAYRPTSLARDFRSLFVSIIPALSTEPIDSIAGNCSPDNNFAYNFTVSPCLSLCEFFSLPVSVVSPIDIHGFFDGSRGEFLFMCDTEWLGQGANSFIEDPDVVISLNAPRHEGNVFVECSMPTKKGQMEVSTHISGNDGVLNANILWSLIREKPINGTIDLSTIFSRDEHQNLVTQVNFNPGTINFGNEIWNILKSEIIYADNRAQIHNFALVTVDSDEDLGLGTTKGLMPWEYDNNDSQSVAINGILSDSPDDLLTVDLKNIQLINIFETLDIDKALISGFATGTIEGRALLSKNPMIECESLNINSIGYNYCTIGDAVAHLSFDDGGSVFNFSADITQPQGHHSSLSGYIVPATEELNLIIDADYVKVGFMKPFMEAFTSDVKGYASGNANLYGTFKDIDLKGDIFVDSLGIKIDFTNTWYYASDSIHIRPGIIKLDKITIRDEYGAEAVLNGWVGHKYFHEASFDFSVTGAENFLCYDMPSSQSPIWYGRIFGSGWVRVTGEPGTVDIKARITTDNNSVFNFVLSDQEEADEYKFITFRDVTPVAVADPILDVDTTPVYIQDIIKGNNNKTDDVPTNYTINLDVMATPQAQLIIVMDPVGGDRIVAYGSGHMQMMYESIENNLWLYGKYTLDKGDYNFTLQDIIRKEFTIDQGSWINFSGDPYAAELNIDAYATIQANLSDLDESFLLDKDLNRTNVPVHAMLFVRGDMLQPNISFDLQFPSLKEDAYRKVKSIVSTEDMMSKQIIYLLALGRFYTPEYMTSTTKGNELFSVASSTLASQLSNMLGKLSENWSIAPNLRSDRGDFSDVEVDLTLSSTLLNNRLLFNGNFGYRDKSLNTNQFVGDFDIEYLLTPNGIWRLKAYNRYNDQNYYLRTAQTTQGIGVVYRKDFDSTLGFLRHLRFWDRDDAKSSLPLDSIPPAPSHADIKETTDSISAP